MRTGEPRTRSDTRAGGRGRSDGETFGRACGGGPSGSEGWRPEVGGVRSAGMSNVTRQGRGMSERRVGMDERDQAHRVALEVAFELAHSAVQLIGLRPAVERSVQLRS